MAVLSYRRLLNTQNVTGAEEEQNINFINLIWVKPKQLRVASGHSLGHIAFLSSFRFSMDMDLGTMLTSIWNYLTYVVKSFECRLSLCAWCQKCFLWASWLAFRARCGDVGCVTPYTCVNRVLLAETLLAKNRLVLTWPSGLAVGGTSYTVLSL